MRQGCRRLDDCQAAAVDRVVNEVDARCMREAGEIKIFFFDGPGAIGKTFTVHHILDRLRVRGEVCLVTTTTALAAGLYEGGGTRCTHWLN